ncbi:BZ3500_MvSof-1268-A1-R1_Chr1-3g02030 [Microbotryum saponariae]|uniref:BZ3500_MvSof-1268-A1-R1_Chr1-3g02030 protein n=1 Tax=Microbotryum saponariae TaxID=289078 RepID=A0A2X0MGB5_9BASI|nr:BZ3500_MvSof-1268-A1-R1_Chr1-3g02030 [Microbotryum saponariae]SCZ95197.1 BZ3501_MvSof-1269-A2-R1_Chr1-3g01632 [Microbotryum saponariae]
MSCQDCDNKDAVTLSASTSADTPTSMALLDPTQFVPPTPSSSLPRIVIDFCDRCTSTQEHLLDRTRHLITYPPHFVPPPSSSGRWLHRATWVQTELFLTFPTTSETGIRAIALVPRTSPETGGRFRVWIYREGTQGKADLVWDRKIEGGFPELKVLKQRVRDLIAPQQGLGHSDHHTKSKSESEGEPPELPEKDNEPIPAKENEPEQENEPEHGNEQEQKPAVDDYTPRFRC